MSQTPKNKKLILSILKQLEKPIHYVLEQEEEHKLCNLGKVLDLNKKIYKELSKIKEGLRSKLNESDQENRINSR